MAHETGGVSFLKRWMLRLNNPQQVTRTQHPLTHAALAWAGRVGWCGKAVVYASIGGLAAKAAATNHHPAADVSPHFQLSASPQGAFVLLGTTPGGVDVVILLVMMVALAAYITWRFWEGLAGQGYDSSFSAAKNFFKFRVSPLVSGAVYVTYLAFIVRQMHLEVHGVAAQPNQEGWPATWRHSTGGRVGLALLGIAFLIATAIQLQGVLSRQWHRDYRHDTPWPARAAVFAAGHVGFAGRAGAFLALAVFFFKDAAGIDDASHSGSMVSNALLQLQDSRGLRALLMIIGCLLIVYGAFATASSWAREFPTLPPTRTRTVVVLPRSRAGSGNGSSDGSDAWPSVSPHRGRARGEQELAAGAVRVEVVANTPEGSAHDSKQGGSLFQQLDEHVRSPDDDGFLSIDISR